MPPTHQVNQPYTHTGHDHARQRSAEYDQRQGYATPLDGPREVGSRNLLAFITAHSPPLWEAYAGVSHFLLRQYDEALATVERAPKLHITYAYMASAQAELDRLDDARGTIKTLLKLAPHFTLKEVARIWPFRIDEDRNRVLDGLRKAGLPEG